MNRYRITRRNGHFYLVDKDTGQRKSLKTANLNDAKRLLAAANEASHQPLLGKKLAETYYAASEPEAMTRTWRHVIDEIIKLKEGSTRERWDRAAKDEAFGLLKPLLVIKTRSQDFLDVLNAGSVATNVFLRRIHNFALDMDWLFKPVLPKRHWPKIEFKEKRAITTNEHIAIIERELNPEKRAFYELCWHLGGSQGDIAQLNAEDIDWENTSISYVRRKTGTISLMRFGDRAALVLKNLPKSGPLFPHLRTLRASDRASWSRPGERPGCSATDIGAAGAHARARLKALICKAIHGATPFTTQQMDRYSSR
jgi:integrase